jgi:hypothetical protein
LALSIAMPFASSWGRFTASCVSMILALLF